MKVKDEKTGKKDDGSLESSPQRRYFTPAEAAAAFSPEFFDEAACRAWILSKLHPDGPACPDCEARLTAKTSSAFFAGRRVVCPGCGRKFKPVSETVLQGAQLDCRQVFLISALIYVMETGLTPARIAEIIGVSDDTVRNWMKKFKVIRYIDKK